MPLVRTFLLARKITLILDLAALGIALLQQVVKVRSIERINWLREYRQHLDNSQIYVTHRSSSNVFADHGCLTKRPGSIA
jgi:hypothetical protein